MGSGERILLTGLPGGRAKFVLRELLARDGARVRALVHESDLADVAVMLEGLGVEAKARVDVVEGDPSSMDLGLSGSEFKALAREITHIHHCAVTTYSAVDRDVAHAVNVNGAREILELADACRTLASLLYHSTVSVSGGREGVVREDDPVAEGGFRNAVEETLARAERMMRSAASSLPIVVTRAGMIVGDSKTGEIDRLDGFYLLVLLIMTSPRELALPLPTRADAKLHLVPLDYVARAAVALAHNPKAVGRTIHLVDPQPLPVRRVLDVVAQATGRRMGKGFIPANVTKALLNAPGIDRIARSPRSVLDALVTRVTYEHKNATELLAGTGIDCPPFEAYVDVLIDAVRRRMDERRERRSPVDYDPLV